MTLPEYCRFNENYYKAYNPNFLDFKNTKMKKVILFAFIFLAGMSYSFGQLITEEVSGMSQGRNNGFSIELRESDKKEVEKLYSKYAKEFKGKTKKAKNTGEYFTDNGTINAMGNNDVDIYASFQQSGSNVMMTMWFDLGGAYLSSGMHPDEALSAENVIMDFALQVSVNMLEDELKAEERILKRLEDDYGKLRKDKEGYEKDIADAEKKIEERKRDIEQNLIDQENKTIEIENQKSRLMEVQSKLKSVQ